MDIDNRPPLFRSWNSWYALVAGVLGALIIFFYWLTQSYA